MPLRVPRAVIDAFGRRLADVDDECRAVLLVTAVCGADLRLIADVCGALGLDVARLEEAEDRGLIVVRNGTVEFRHPLLRSATYSGASAQSTGVRRTVLPLRPPRRRTGAPGISPRPIWHPDSKIAALLADSGRARRGARRRIRSPPGRSSGPRA